MTVNTLNMNKHIDADAGASLCTSTTIKIHTNIHSTV